MREICNNAFLISCVVRFCPRACNAPCGKHAKRTKSNSNNNHWVVPPGMAPRQAAGCSAILNIFHT